VVLLWKEYATAAKTERCSRHEMQSLLKQDTQRAFKHLKNLKGEDLNNCVKLREIRLQ